MPTEILVLIILVLLAILSSFLVLGSLVLIEGESLILSSVSLCGILLLHALFSFLVFILHLLPSIVSPLFFRVCSRSSLLLRLPVT